ncbi:hypothetical protein DMA15_35560 [Streptomyces sp. WAC 01529]|nr:hypothetical protein DMA15_35560 [Streptomyces sp. WAC 01529]
MDERNPASPGQDGPPVPRDMPDQQASDENDAWEADTEAAASGDAPDEGVPDTDEAGTGRRGDADPDAPGPGPDEPEENPEPDEPTA